MSEEATWVGRRAVAWVMDDAPVPADLAFTLVVIARRCDENGRGSYQSQRVIAEKTGKSPDQVARDIRRLRAMGLLLLGDQSLPEKHGVPHGRRPPVYDVPLGLKGPKPSKASKNKSGQRKADDTHGMDAPPVPMPHPLHGSPPTPGMDAGGGPCMDAPLTPRMEAPQTRREQDRNNTVSQSTRAREASRWLHDRYGLTDDEAQQVIDQVRARAAAPIAHLVPYMDGMADGDLADIADAVMRPTPAHPPEDTGEAWPEWCGSCNHITRQAGDPDHPYRCPDCHPLRKQEAS